MHLKNISDSEQTNSNSLDSLPKKRSRVSTRTEDFEYELSPAGTGRRRRSARTNQTVEPKIKYELDCDSRYECPACPMKFDFDYGLLTHVESHPVLPCTCHLCDEFFGSGKVHGLVFHFLKCHQSIKQIKRRDCIGITAERTRTLRSSAPAENQLAMAEFSPVKSPVFGMELVPFSCSRTTLRSRLIAEKNTFDSGFPCPHCHRLFPVYSGLEQHFQNCSKPIEKPKTKSRKRKTRTSLMAAGAVPLVLENDIKNPEPEQAELKISDKDMLYNSLGVVPIQSEQESDSLPTKSLPMFFPENEPTFNSQIPINLDKMFNLKIIDAVDCSGQGKFVEIKEEYMSEKTKPTKGRITPKRTPRSNTHLVKEEVKDEKSSKDELNIPLMPSPAKKIKKEAVQEGPYHCKLCSDTFFTESDLNDHEKTRHIKIQTYQCKICNYCSLEKSLMIRHMRTHSGQRPFYCKECGYAFTTKANCERHIRKRHNKAEKSQIDDLIRCDQNQLKTVSEDSWKYEIATVCMHCDEKFPDFWSLRDHLKIHDKRSFYCSDCNAAFSCRSNCIAHIMQKHEVTDREEANEKVKYEPGGGAKSKRKKISDDVQEDPEEHDEHETIIDLPQDTFTCKLCQKGFEAFIPYLNHLDDFHYKIFARNSLQIKDEVAHDFEKLFSAAQRAKDVVHSGKTRLSTLSRWDLRNYMMNRRATRMYKARMIPFKRINEIRNRKKEENSRISQNETFGNSKNEKLDLNSNNTSNASSSYSPRIHTIKRNPSVGDSGSINSHYQPHGNSGSSQSIHSNSPISRTTMMPHKSTHPVQSKINPDRNYIQSQVNMSGEHHKNKQNWIMTPKRPNPSMNHSSGHNPSGPNNSQQKSTVLHVQRRDSPRKPSLSSQPIKVQVPKSLMTLKPINKESKGRVVLQNQSYQTKQAFMLQAQKQNTLNVPTTVYQKPINPSVPSSGTVYQKPMNQIFLKDSANKTFHVIQRPKQNETQQSGPMGSKIMSNHSIPSNSSQGAGTSNSNSQVTAYESSGPYQNKPTRLTSANGNSYEIKGIPNSQSNYSSNNQRGLHVFEVSSRKSIIQQNKSAGYNQSQSSQGSNHSQHSSGHVSHHHQQHSNTANQSQGSQSQQSSQPVYATLNPVRTTYNTQSKSSYSHNVQRQSPTTKGPSGHYRSMPLHDQYQNQVGKPVRVQIQSNQSQSQGRNDQSHHQKFHQIKPNEPNQWNDSHGHDDHLDNPEAEYESDRDQDQFDGDEQKIAKNVDNLGDAAYVKAKGTWYRARKCHKCGKTFPWASSLRRHLMTHTGLKPYCCAQCKAQFTTKSNLERHILRRHGVLDKEGQAKYVIKLSQKELERQLEQENEELKAEAELTGTDDGSKMEEIVEEDGIVYDYQNANGEVIKRESPQPPQQHYLQSPKTQSNQMTHHWNESQRK